VKFFTAVTEFPEANICLSNIQIMISLLNVVNAPSSYSNWWSVQALLSSAAMRLPMEIHTESTNWNGESTQVVLLDGGTIMIQWCGNYDRLMFEQFFYIFIALGFINEMSKTNTQLRGLPETTFEGSGESHFIRESPVPGTSIPSRGVPGKGQSISLLANKPSD